MKKISTFFAIVILGLSVSSTTYARDKQEEQRIEAIRVEVEKVCMEIKPFIDRPEKLKGIKIEVNPEINAYADDKGYITFLTGMLDFVRNRDELAIICGHEMTHLSAQHIKRSLGTSILATIAQTAIGGTVGDIAGTALYNKQSRKHEREADSTGVLYAWKAGFDPRVAWKLWADLTITFQAGNSKLEKFLGSHPVTDERVENFKVLLVRDCKENKDLPHCDEIMNDEQLIAAFNNFETRK